MYLCKAGGETPTCSDDRVQTHLLLQFFKADDLENEMTLKVKSRSPKSNHNNSSFCHNDTMHKVKLEYTLFNSRESYKIPISDISKVTKI